MYTSYFAYIIDLVYPCFAFFEIIIISFHYPAVIINVIINESVPDCLSLETRQFEGSSESNRCQGCREGP